MSLRAFHILFITASTLLALGLSGWLLYHYFAKDGGGQDLALSIGSLVAGVLLIVYGNYVFRKLKRLG